MTDDDHDHDVTNNVLIQIPENRNKMKDNEVEWQTSCPLQYFSLKYAVYCAYAAFY